MIRTLDDLRARLSDVRSADPSGRAARVALVSTLGALHEGHVDLIREARRHADVVVVSTFVNPLRFRTAEETAAYPRSPEADADLLADLGVDLVFAPTAAEFLPAGTATTRVAAGDLGFRYEGRSRPFYFDGVLTVE
ncbi:MAG: panthothenate synthetase, partial [Microbacterium sp.]|nr:panthothenate synthetase [Microbacterium sp.]